MLPSRDHLRLARGGKPLLVATEVELFGIKITVEYAPEGTAEDMWAKYHGTQLGDALFA